MMQPPCQPGELRFSTGCGLGISEKNSAEFDDSQNENQESRLMAPGCGQCYLSGYASPYESATITVKPKIQLYRNGSLIDPNTAQDVVVGQRISLSATITGGTPSSQ
ncbi:MAG TPA: hypothetical protein VF596_16345, partial [Pyrinomonadaceae bacterium]